ncbi:carboxypeptidase regulatory-like domain-containing protein [Leptolyngbya cf. ectocarpi LEGE 11479]|uniref:Carboxypeptidase regulatory-like domain-containing protein n=1 Tax=Leptolyngbya cf. ectocarpi LEGE 11479 TaxID=1828722 RepID=A0A929A0L2_LEPEC|nr:carboxypeptidase-like regulatory domain-containing protein [Leptolyngbya ectocarpi]MBE9070803.1 carboxypeptidase regulatory-like domain-containing protein [Leptolyngbya cf. ectocarpi LEGE 11479]
MSTLSSQDTFQLEISPRFNLQRGIGLGSHRQDWLRTQGGLMIQPFLDDNNNSQRDPGESGYLEDLDLLVTVNHQPLDYYQPQIQNGHATIALTPGLYRIDLDPAGFPLDRQAVDQAVAAEVTPGEYTQVLIPLGRSFSVSGVVLDADGHAMGGQQVKIVNTTSDRSQLSVTNGAGVFYLEGISPGRYRFEIGDQAVESTTLDFSDTTQPFQEVNFKVLPHGIETQIPSLGMDLP